MTSSESALEQAKKISDIQQLIEKFRAENTVLIDNLQQAKDDDTEDEIINELTKTASPVREKLQTILIEAQVKEDKVLINTAYNALITLAELAPLNLRNQINDKIAPEYQVYTLAGALYDVRELISYHNSRPASTIEENNGKYLTDFYRKIFSPLDRAHILEIAQKNNDKVNSNKINEEIKKISATIAQLVTQLSSTSIHASQNFVNDNASIEQVTNLIQQNSQSGIQQQIENLQKDIKDLQMKKFEFNGLRPETYSDVILSLMPGKKFDSVTADRTLEQKLINEYNQNKTHTIKENLAALASAADIRKKYPEQLEILNRTNMSLVELLNMPSEHRDLLLANAKKYHDLRTLDKNNFLNVQNLLKLDFLVFSFLLSSNSAHTYDIFYTISFSDFLKLKIEQQLEVLKEGYFYRQLINENSYTLEKIFSIPKEEREEITNYLFEIHELFKNKFLKLNFEELFKIKRDKRIALYQHSFSMRPVIHHFGLSMADLDQLSAEELSHFYTPETIAKLRTHLNRFEQNYLNKASFSEETIKGILYNYGFQQLSRDINPGMIFNRSPHDIIALPIEILAELMLNISFITKIIPSYLSIDQYQKFSQEFRSLIVIHASALLNFFQSGIMTADEFWKITEPERSRILVQMPTIFKLIQHKFISNKEDLSNLFLNNNLNEILFKETYELIALSRAFQTPLKLFFTEVSSLGCLELFLENINYVKELAKQVSFSELKLFTKEQLEKILTNTKNKESQKIIFSTKLQPHISSIQNIDTQTYPEVIKIIKSLQQLQKTQEIKLVEECRGYLNTLLIKVMINTASTYFDKVHNALIALAELAPVNMTDFHIDEDISAEDQVVAPSAGYKFNMRTFTDYSYNHSRLYNPHTHEELSFEDTTYIVNQCNKNKLKFQSLKETPHSEWLYSVIKRAADLNLLSEQIKNISENKTALLNFFEEYNREAILGIKENIQALLDVIAFKDQYSEEIKLLVTDETQLTIFDIMRLPNQSRLLFLKNAEFIHQLSHAVFSTLYGKRLTTLHESVLPHFFKLTSKLSANNIADIFKALDFSYFSENLTTEQQIEVLENIDAIHTYIFRKNILSLKELFSEYTEEQREEIFKNTYKIGRLTKNLKGLDLKTLFTFTAEQRQALYQEDDNILLLANGFSLTIEQLKQLTAGELSHPFSLTTRKKLALLTERSEITEKEINKVRLEQSPFKMAITRNDPSVEEELLNFPTPLFLSFINNWHFYSQLVPHYLSLKEFKELSEDARQKILDFCSHLQILIETGVLSSVQEFLNLEPYIYSQFTSNYFIDFCKNNKELIRKIVSGYEKSSRQKLDLWEFSKLQLFENELSQLSAANIDFSQLFSLPWEQQIEIFKHRKAVITLIEGGVSITELMTLTTPEIRAKIFKHPRNVIKLKKMGMSFIELIQLDLEKIKLILYFDNTKNFVDLHKAGIPYTEILKLDATPIKDEPTLAGISVLERVLTCPETLDESFFSLEGFSSFLKADVSTQIKILERLRTDKPTSTSKEHDLAYNFQVDVQKIYPTHSKLTKEQREALYKNREKIALVFKKLSLSFECVATFTPDELKNIYSASAIAKLASSMTRNENPSSLKNLLNQTILMTTTENDDEAEIEELHPDIKEYLIDKAQIPLDKLQSLEPEFLFFFCEHYYSIAKLIPKYFTLDEFLALESTFRFEIVSHQRYIQEYLINKKVILSFKELEALAPALRTFMIEYPRDIAALKEANIDFMSIKPDSLREKFIQNGTDMSEFFKAADITLNTFLSIPKPMQEDIIKRSHFMKELFLHRSLLFSSLIQIQPYDFREFVIRESLFIVGTATRFGVSVAKLLGLGLDKLKLIRESKEIDKELASFISFEELKNKITAPELRIVLEDLESTAATRIFDNLKLRSHLAAVNFELFLLLGNNQNYVPKDYVSGLSDDNQKSIYKINHLFTEFSMNNSNPEELREELLSLYLQAKKQNHIPLSNAVHRFLLILADQYPINNDNYIPASKRIVVSYGEQLNIYDLIKTHAERAPIEEHGETKDRKYLCHPVTGYEFSSDNIYHIQQEARERKIPIPALIIEEEMIEEIEEHKKEDVPDQVTNEEASNNSQSPQSVELATIEVNEHHNVINSSAVQTVENEEDLLREIISLDDVQTESESEDENNEDEDNESETDDIVTEQTIDISTIQAENIPTENTKRDENNNNTIPSYAQTTNNFFQPAPAAAPTIKFSELMKFILSNNVAIYFDNLPAETQKIIQEKNLNKNEVEFLNKLTTFDLAQFNTPENIAEFIRVFESVAEDISISYLNCETLLNFALSKGCEAFYGALSKYNKPNGATAFIKLYPICKQHSSIANGLIHYLDSIDSKHTDLITQLKKIINDSMATLKETDDVVNILWRKICASARLNTKNFPDEIRVVSDFLNAIMTNSDDVNPKLTGKVSASSNLDNNRMFNQTTEMKGITTDPNNNNNTTQNSKVAIPSYALTTSGFFSSNSASTALSVKFSELMKFILYNNVAIYFDNLPAETQKIIQEKNLNKNEIEFLNDLTTFDLAQFNTPENVAEFIRVFESVAEDISTSYLKCETLLNFALSKGCEAFYDALSKYNKPNGATAFIKLYPICKQHSSIANGLIHYLDSIDSKHTDLVTQLKKIINDSMGTLKETDDVVNILWRKICANARLNTKNFPDEIRVVSDFLNAIMTNSDDVNPKLTGKVSASSNLDNNKMPS